MNRKDKTENIANHQRKRDNERAELQHRIEEKMERA